MSSSNITEDQEMQISRKALKHSETKIVHKIIRNSCVCDYVQKLPEA